MLKELVHWHLSTTLIDKIKPKITTDENLVTCQKCKQEIKIKNLKEN